LGEIKITGEFKMLYVRLFHGRTDPNQDMDKWGSHGPVFGPYEFIHSAYAFSLELGNHDTCDELFYHDGMVYYDGIYYGNWCVFDERTFKDGRYQRTVFEPSKANLPKS